MYFSLFTDSLQGYHEKRLLNHLLNTYNSLERPVANESESLEVKFGLTLQQIIDVVSYPFFMEIFHYNNLSSNTFITNQYKCIKTNRNINHRKISG